MEFNNGVFRSNTVKHYRNMRIVQQIKLENVRIEIVVVISGFGLNFYFFNQKNWVIPIEIEKLKNLPGIAFAGNGYTEKHDALFASTGTTESEKNIMFVFGKGKMVSFYTKDNSFLSCNFDTKSVSLIPLDNERLQKLMDDEISKKQILNDLEESFEVTLQRINKIRSSLEFSDA